MSVESCDTRSDGPHVVKSAGRTLQILELFDELQRPLNVVAVSEALGYPQSSTAALLRSLVAMGYLHYNDRARTYIPTDRVSLLGSWISPPLFEEAALPRLLRAIGQRTGQLVLLAARNGDFAQYIHVLNAPDAVTHHIGIGQKRPLATSGVGQILLTAMTDGEIKRLYHRMNAYVPNSENKINVTELLATLAVVRQAGHAFSRNRVVEGYGMIAVRLPTDCTNRPLVVGVGGLCDVLERREAEILAIVREEMARCLGSRHVSDQLRSSATSAFGSIKAANEARVA